MTPAQAQQRGRLILAMVRGCLYRSALPKRVTGCADCKARCHAGKGVGGMVTVAECSRCIVASGAGSGEV
jgi:hypothetical protein